MSRKRATIELEANPDDDYRSERLLFAAGFDRVGKVQAGENDYPRRVSRAAPKTPRNQGGKKGC